MPAINMTHFPRLRPMLQQRERQANQIRLHREKGPVHGDQIVQFWTALAEQIQQAEEPRQIKALLSELNADIDMLKALRQTLEIHKGEPAVEQKIAQVLRAILLLLETEERLRKWYGHLRDKRLAHIMSINIAVPSKARDKKKMEDDKKLKGQKKAKKALDQTQKKKEEPTKKMDA